jgi:hypothetical protein
LYALLSLFDRGGLKFFFQFFDGLHPSESMLLTCLCVVSKLNALSLLLLYLAGLEPSMSFTVFLC